MRPSIALAVAGATLTGATLLGAGGVLPAAGIDCNGRVLSRTEQLICGDAQLLRGGEQLSRRTDRIARLMDYGQYVGLRLWQAASARQRNLCGVDRACISVQHRAQNRVLDRVQQCLDTRVARRSCLRNALAGDRETMRR